MSSPLDIRMDVAGDRVLLDTIPDDGLSGQDPCQDYSLGKVEELGCKTASGREYESASPSV